MTGSHGPKVEVDYNLVLADMKARHEALGHSIASMEAWLRGGSAPLPASAAAGNGHNPSKVDVDTFVGMTIPSATARYLQMVGKPARTTEAITDALNSGGLNVSRPSVATVLGREESAGGVIRRAAKGLWGLREWYGS